MDFTSANALFKERETKAVEARAAYLAIGQAATDAKEKEFAYSQIARLDYFRGEILLGRNATDDAKRNEIFAGCAKDMDAIKGANEAYFGFKLMCFTYWAQVASSTERLGSLGDELILTKGPRKVAIEQEITALEKQKIIVTDESNIDIANREAETKDLQFKEIQKNGANWFEENLNALPVELFSIYVIRNFF